LENGIMLGRDIAEATFDDRMMYASDALALDSINETAQGRSSALKGELTMIKTPV